MLEPLGKLMLHVKIFPILANFEVVWAPIVNVGCFKFVASRIGDLYGEFAFGDVGLSWASHIGHQICSSIRISHIWAFHMFFMSICKKEREVELSLKTTNWHRNMKFTVMGCTYNLQCWWQPYWHHEI